MYPITNVKKELSKREKEVLKLLTKGFNNSEIAQELIISEHTSRAHVKSILEKLDARNRTTAAVIAITRNLV